MNAVCRWLAPPQAHRARVAAVLSLLLTLLAPVPAVHAGDAVDTAAAGSAPREDLLSKDMTELVQMEVTTVSKKQEPWFRTPAAVTVLTSEDIRRSGAETIPDALRLLPGMEVARLDATKWAVSARGFNSRFANKLLVLIDGRSVYTPLFSGVMWDEQDLLLDDIERIEVIRGPGAALWGSNAVNGVINIITKDSQDTQGALGRAARGTTERMYGGARYGGRLGGAATYRAYALGYQRKGLEGPGIPAVDRGWDAERAGFRVDWNPSRPNELSLVGHVHSSAAQQAMSVPILSVPYRTTVSDRILFRGADVLGRWVHHADHAGDFTTQTSLDLSDRDEYLGHEKRATVDLDFQHRFHWRPSQETAWGTSYRLTADDMHTEHFVQIDDSESHRTDHMVGLFVQHEATFTPRVSLTVGNRFEASRYGKPNVQPNARLAYQPNDRQALWLACSRALRVAARGERTATMRMAVFPDPYSGLPVAATYVAASDLGSERVTAFEAGWRVRPTDNLLLDVSGYHNEYRDLVLAVPGTPSPAMEGLTPYIFYPLKSVNAARATGDGVETAVRLAVTPQWQVRATHTWTQIDYGQSFRSGGTTVTASALPPRHSGSLQSLLQLPGRVELDSRAVAVGRLEGTPVPAYQELFLRLGWRPVPGIEASVLGENLLHRRHLEFPDDVNFAAVYVERGVRFSLRYVR